MAAAILPPDPPPEIACFSHTLEEDHIRWQSERSSALLNDTSLRALRDLLPPGPAVYVWREGSRAPRNALTSPSSFLRWVREEVREPLVVLEPGRLTHWLTIDKLIAGPGPLSPLKEQTLHQLAQSPKGRRLVIDMLDAANQFRPAIYVGETGDLPVRIHQHLSNQTDFARRLLDAGRSLEGLDLSFFRLPGEGTASPEQARQLRILLEDLITGVALGTFVERPG